MADNQKLVFVPDNEEEIIQTISKSITPDKAKGKERGKA
jgi:hypothetical protein